MKKTFSRIMCVAIIAVMILGLAACGNNSGGETYLQMGDHAIVGTSPNSVTEKDGATETMNTMEMTDATTGETECPELTDNLSTKATSDLTDMPAPEETTSPTKDDKQTSSKEEEKSGDNDSTSSNAPTSSLDKNSSGDNKKKNESDKSEETKATEATAEATKPATHTHKYTSKVVKPDCVNEGYTVHTCSCGHSYTDSRVNALGHDEYYYSEAEPSYQREGYILYGCYNCDKTRKEITAAALTLEEYEQAVAVATVKYINEYRNADVEVLPGLTEVAQYRAVMLIDYYSHYTEDGKSGLREALAAYKYGIYHDMSIHGLDESYNYYSCGPEAIAQASYGQISADTVGKRLAKCFYESAEHWAYVGDDKYEYIGVGITYREDAEGGWTWKCCVIVTEENYG